MRGVECTDVAFWWRWWWCVESGWKSTLSCAHFYTMFLMNHCVLMTNGWCWEVIREKNDIELYNNYAIKAHREWRKISHYATCSDWIFSICLSHLVQVSNSSCFMHTPPHAENKLLTNSHSHKINFCAFYLLYFYGWIKFRATCSFFFIYNQ